MAKKPTNALTVRSITSFDDFQVGTFTAVIIVGDEQWEVPCKELTYAEFYAIDNEIADPTPPQFSGPTGTIWMTDDPGYKKAKQEAQTERLMQRLAEMLQIEGKSRAEKREALRHASMAFITGLTNVLQQTQLAQEARIEAKSHSFRSAGTSNGTHPQDNGVDAGVLAEPIAG